MSGGMEWARDKERERDACGVMLRKFMIALGALELADVRAYNAVHVKCYNAADVWIYG